MKDTGSEKKDNIFLEPMIPPSLDEGQTYLGIKDLERLVKDKESPQSSNTNRNK